MGIGSRPWANTFFFQGQGPTAPVLSELSKTGKTKPQEPRARCWVLSRVSTAVVPRCWPCYVSAVRSGQAEGRRVISDVREKEMSCRKEVG